MQEDETVRAARRELEKLSAEGGLSSTPMLKSQAESIKGHFQARDVDQADPAELWGTRIARGLALLAVVGLLAYLYMQYVR